MWFQEITANHVRHVGKKGVSLSELARAGARIPHGFVLTLEAFDSTMTETGLSDAIGTYLKGFEKQALQNLGAAEVAGSHIFQLISTTQLPDSVRIPLFKGYDQLCEIANESKLPVAVRSSGPISRPGLFSSYLNVTGKTDIEKKVMECYASAYLPRALAMRAQQGQPLEWEPIGVVICQFIDARTAGVLFTVHPTTGNQNKWVIEASWGLGESVVQASVAPDRFAIDRDRLKIEERDINTKLTQVVPSGRGVKVEAVSPQKQDAPSLSDEEIRTLVKKAKLVVDYFKGVPQDIEWAISKSHHFPDNLFLLQTRPVIRVEPGGKSIEKPDGRTDAEHIANLMIERLFE